MPLKINVSHIHNRQSIRLRGWNYAGAGTYFITICVQNMRHVFGTVVKGRMVINELGRVAEACWRAIPTHFPHAELDEFIIMPNHVHGIVRIVGENVVPPPPVPQGRPHGTSRTIGSIVRGFKIGVGIGANVGAKNLSPLQWQRNYYERIIRDAAALENVRRYIRENPENFTMLQCGEPRVYGNADLLTLPRIGFMASREVGAKNLSPVRFPLKPGTAIISGFLSPAERRLYRAGMARGVPMIWVRAWGTNVGAKNLSPPPPNVVMVTPFDESITAPSARRAMWCNEYVMNHCDELCVGHLTPGGMLECLLSDVPPILKLVRLGGEDA